MPSAIVKCSPRIQDGFYDLRTRILEIAYKGALFDEAMAIRPGDSDGDNFDIAMDTSGKLSILRPVLRSEILDPMITEVRSRRIAGLDDALNTFYPIPEDTDKDSSHASNLDPEKHKKMPSWLQKWAPGKHLKNLRWRQPAKPRKEHSVQNKKNPKRR